MTGPYYAQRAWRRDGKWAVWKRTVTGDRLIANQMSEASARKIARLLNDEPSKETTGE